MQMEVQQINKCDLIIKQIIKQQSTYLLSCFVSFLDLEALEVIGLITLQFKRYEKIFKLALAKLFMKKYYNRVDRSIFFLFYEEPDFVPIEKSAQNYLAFNKTDFICQIYKSYQELLAQFQKQCDIIDNPHEISEILENLFFQTDLPLPKLKRETIGMHCESPFQEMLSLIKFPPQADPFQWVEPPLQQLKDQLVKEMEKIIEFLSFNKNKDREAIKILTVRYAGYKITQKNWKQFIIPNFKTHNLLVIIFALCNQFVLVCKTFVMEIKDPLLKFVEFSLRSNIYRNILLAVQEKFKFLMETYDTIFSQNFISYIYFPELNFWRPGMSIWLIHMAELHPQFKIIQSYISSRVREKNMCDYLIKKIQKLPSFYTTLKQQLDSSNYSFGKKEVAYAQNENKEEIQQFFENNDQNYEILLKEYLEYMVDCSSNAINIHWCGHSQHNIIKKTDFSNYNQVTIDNSLHFYKFIRSILYKDVPQEVRLNILRQVIKEDLSFIDNKIVKNVNLKEIIKVVNQWISSEVQNLPKYVIFSQQGKDKYEIRFDFEEKDALIQYFANKSEIPPDCRLEERFLYDYERNILINFNRFKGNVKKISIDEQSEGSIQDKYESSEEDVKSQQKDINKL